MQTQRQIAVLSLVAGILAFSSTVLATPPVLEVSPTYLEFSAYEDGNNPANQILSIWRGGGDGPLNWEVTEACGWIVVEPNSGKSMGEVDDVNVIVDISGLAVGSYNCQLTVDAGTAVNSPQIVDVNLIVYRPVIEVSSTYFEFTAFEDGTNPDEQVLSISNSGTGELNWQITEVCGWLSVEPNSGSSTGEADDVNLSVDITGLGGGIYNCELLISDPNAENNPQTVAVILRLGDGDSQLHVPSEYGTIQAAIDVAVYGNTVVVEPNTYTGADNKDLDFGGKAITVRSTVPEDPCVVAATVIDCENSGRGFYFHSGEDANSIVAGLTVKNGEIQGTLSNPDGYGGGIYCSGASPTILNCSILNCSVYGWRSGSSYVGHGEAYGGGISCVSGSHPTIVDCEISGNLARASETIGDGWCDAYGGGVFCSSDSTVAIYNSKITANIAHGGKWHSSVSWISVACHSYGGGIYISGSIGSNIKNCLIVNNETVLVTGQDYEGINYGKSQGAGIFCKGDVNVVNCTIAGNYTDPNGIRGDGGGIYGPSMVINNIIWDNLSASQLFGTTSVTYSDIEGSFLGTGNIDTDPCFVTGPLGDYYLSQVAAGQASDSPCVDTGSDTAANLGMDIFTTRTDEVVDVDIVDMGCHYPAPNPADIDDDGDVDFVDYAILADKWLEVGPGVSPADIAPIGGGDYIVDFADLDLLVHYWLWWE